MNNRYMDKETDFFNNKVKYQLFSDTSSGLRSLVISKEKYALEPWWRHVNAHKVKQSTQYVLHLTSGLKSVFDNTDAI